MHAATYGDHCTAVDIGFVLFGCVETAFRLTCSLGDDHTTVDIEVLIGVDGIVVVAAGIHIAAVDIEVACRVDGVVVAIALYGTCLDVDFTLALDTLRAVAGAFEPHLRLSAVEGQVAVGLDALWRNAAL